MYNIIILLSRLKLFPPFGIGHTFISEWMNMFNFFSLCHSSAIRSAGGGGLCLYIYVYRFIVPLFPSLRLWIHFVSIHRKRTFRTAYGLCILLLAKTSVYFVCTSVNRKLSKQNKCFDRLMWIGVCTWYKPPYICARSNEKRNRTKSEIVFEWKTDKKEIKTKPVAVNRASRYSCFGSSQHFILVSLVSIPFKLYWCLWWRYFFVFILSFVWNVQRVFGVFQALFVQSFRLWFFLLFIFWIDSIS